MLCKFLKVLKVLKVSYFIASRQRCYILYGKHVNTSTIKHVTCLTVGSVAEGLKLFPLTAVLSSSDEEDEDLHSTDPESREKSKDKRPLCKVKWSRDEVGDHPNP